jgi:8-oxo-dGTP pyrophosphatase MutT (NUDIX family)
VVSITLSLTEDKIRTRLNDAISLPSTAPFSEIAFPPDFLPENPRPAAVLIPLLRINDNWHILFTRRTTTLPEHSGQVAFPGGSSDPSDASPQDTALRETFEEIGLLPGMVRILGSLNSLQTISNYCVTPVVGVIPWPYPFQLEQVEVDRIFTIPLLWLSDPGNHEIKQRALPSPFPPIPVVYFHIYDGELLWGVSAQITLNFLVALGLLINKNPSSIMKRGECE